MKPLTPPELSHTPACSTFRCDADRIETLPNLFHSHYHDVLFDYHLKGDILVLLCHNAFQQTPYLNSLHIINTQPSYRGNSFWSLVTTDSIFWSLPTAHGHRCGLECRWTGKSISAQLPVYHTVYLPVMDNTPRYLNSFAWGSNLPPGGSNLRIFQQRTQASNLS